MTLKRSIIAVIGGGFPPSAMASVDPERVSLGDIESRLRSVAPNAQERLDTSNANALAPVFAGGAALLGAVYFLGRRRGKKRATILEIRRT